MSYLRKIILALVVDAGLFGGLNAQQASSLELMLGFIMLLVTSYYLAYGLVVAAGWYGLKFRHRRRLAIYIASAAGVIVALQSIGELGTRDVAVIMGLGLLAYLYSSYGETKQTGKLL